MTETTVVKVTKRDRFAEVRTIIEASGVANTAELLQFIDHEVELLNRKKSSSSKENPENESIKNQILEVLTDYARPMTCTEIVNIIGVNQSKTSAMLKKLIDEDNKVVRTKDKKTSLFSIAE